MALLSNFFRNTPLNCFPGQTDGALDCPGLASSVGDDDIAVDTEKTCPAILGIVQFLGPRTQPDIPKQVTSPETGGAGKDTPHVTYGCQKIIAETFNSLENDITGEAVGDDNVGGSFLDVLSLYIADEVYIFGFFKDFITVMNKSVALAILGAVAEKADTRRFNFENMLAVNGTQPGEFKQVFRTAIGIGPGVNQERRERLDGIKKTRDGRAGNTVGLAESEQRRSHNRSGIARRYECIGTAALEKVNPDHNGRVRLILDSLHRRLIIVDYLLGIDDADTQFLLRAPHQHMEHVPPAHEGNVYSVILGGFYRPLDHFMGGVVAPGGINSDYHLLL
jgi:hypothetical protein